MTEDRTFGKMRFSDLPAGDYYRCVFSACDFSGQVLAGGWEECEFRGCDLSLARITGAVQSVRFVECRFTGADLSQMQGFSRGLDFTDCRLDYVSFSAWKFRESRFERCMMRQADFERADVAFSVFERCDLSGAVFHRTNLEGCDLRSSYGFTIDPSANRLKKAVFSPEGLPGLLAHTGIVVRETDS